MTRHELEHNQRAQPEHNQRMHFWGGPPTTFHIRFGGEPSATKSTRTTRWGPSPQGRIHQKPLREQLRNSFPRREVKRGRFPAVPLGPPQRKPPRSGSGLLAVQLLGHFWRPSEASGEHKKSTNAHSPRGWSCYPKGRPSCGPPCAFLVLVYCHDGGIQRGLEYLKKTSKKLRNRPGISYLASSRGNPIHQTERLASDCIRRLPISTASGHCQWRRTMQVRAMGLPQQVR